MPEADRNVNKTPMWKKERESVPAYPVDEDGEDPLLKQVGTQYRYGAFDYKLDGMSGDKPRKKHLKKQSRLKS